jgi:hypothetical protein
VPAGDRGPCQKTWEECETLLGSTDLHALLVHLRTLKRRRNSGKPVESDIAESYKFNIPGSGLAFLSQQLKPAAERFASLRRPRNDARLRAVADHVERLTWTDPQLWIPAALLWLERDHKPAEQLLFFTRLERLVSLMKIAALDPSQQYSRIVRLIVEIGRGLDAGKMSELDISTEIREQALRNLRSGSFDLKKCCAPALRRISVALGHDPGPVERSSLTLEHILPSAYLSKSGWKKSFPSPAAVKLYSHRLGNLTFLTPEDNQEAATLDWAKKRPILARSQFLLSKRVAEAADWNPDQIVGRTEELIRVLFKEWELKV